MMQYSNQYDNLNYIRFKIKHKASLKLITVTTFLYNRSFNLNR